MRQLLVPFVVVSLVFAACDCGPERGELVNAKPEAVVIEPAVQVGGEYLLDFGRVRAGGTYEKHVVIENKGRTDWTVSAVTVRDEETLTALGVERPELPALVATGQRLDLRVTFSPLDKGELGTAIDIDSDDPEQPRITVRIVGVAEAPGIQVCVATDTGGRLCDEQVTPQNLVLDFGLPGLADPAVERSVYIRNNSPLSLTLASAAIATGSSAEFTTSPISGQTLPPDGEVEAKIRYKPNEGGYDTGQYEIASDDPRKPLLRVELRGGGKAPRICAAPVDLDFGGVVKGTSVEKDVVFTSCGAHELELTKMELGQGVGLSPEFTLTTTTAVPQKLAPGAKLVVTVRYSPTDLGQDTGKLEVASDDAKFPAGFILLKGKGVNEPSCDLEITPRSLDFGNVSTRGHSEKVLFGTNVGQKDCVISALNGPAGSAAFTVPAPPALPKVLRPNDVFSVAVRYQPTATQTDTATLTFVSDDAVEPSLAVNLKGTGTAPGPCDFQITPASYNYGSIPSGAIKPQMFKLNNFGTDDCFVTDVTIGQGSSPAFTITKSPRVPDSISSTDTLDVEVTFAPKSGGNHTGNLSVKAGVNFFSVKTYQAQLQGVAGEPALCVTPNLLDFGPQAPGNKRDMGFTLTSCGAGTVELRGLVLDAGTSPEFSFVTKPATPYNLPAGQSLQVMVRYAPTTNGPDFGRVSVLSNDARNPSLPVLLRGNASGCLTKTLNCAPAGLTFPRTAVGQTSTLTFTCFNAGGQDVAMSAVRLAAGTSAEFSLSHKALPPLLKPGQSVRIAVNYTPSGAGTDAGTVEIASDDCQRPQQTVAVAAEGIAPIYPKCIPPKTFSPVTRWSWSPSVETSYKSVWMTPAVANLTDDNADGRIDELDIPDVIFTTHDGTKVLSADPTPPAILRAIDGKTGGQLWNVTDPALRMNASAQLAVADIDGDNKVEVIASLRVVSPGTGMGNMLGKYKTGRLVAFENDGTYKWTSDFWNRDDNEIEDGSAINIADLDNDGVPEIVLGASVFSADGKLLWEGSAGRGTTGHGVFSVVADLNGDGKQEVIAGRTAYSSTGQVLWTYGSRDGYPIVIDVEKDGTPEVVLRTDVATIVVLDGTGKVKYGPHTIPNPPQDACPAAISAADFDKDGKPELAVPSGSAMNMMEPTTGAIVWSQPVEDYGGQCGASGTAAFDFEGDGIVEIVYHDSRNVFAFRGTDGTIVYKEGRTSATIFETPVVADVDNDGHADILTTQDSGSGLKLLNNVTNDWVATRRIWNQYGYHVTNVSEGGSVPRVETPSWTGLNSYRANEPRCSP